MPFSIVFFVSFIIFIALTIRAKQSIITILGGGLIFSSVIGLLLGKPEKQKPQTSPSAIESAISKSDDYQIHRARFFSAANKLILDKKCTLEDFNEIGGWLKSSTHPNGYIYFTYCGGKTIASRIYLNTQTEEIFR